MVSGLDIGHKKYKKGYSQILERGMQFSPPGIIYSFPDDQVFFYHSDVLGSITELTDSTGNVVQTYVYDSFGNIVSQTGTLENPFTYTGREFDAETGIYFYRARYYDANMGRFLQEDPIGFDGGVNFYTYVDNSPTNFIDPLGLQESFPLDPNIPFPYIPIPLPDVVGCFGLATFGNLSWLSSNPTKTNYGLNGAGLGGGIILCYKLDCDSCPKGKGLDKFLFGLSKLFKKRIGVAVGGTLDGNICFAVGPFGSFTPISFAGNLGSF